MIKLIICLLCFILLLNVISLNEKFNSEPYTLKNLYSSTVGDDGDKGIKGEDGEILHNLQTSNVFCRKNHTHSVFSNISHSHYNDDNNIVENNNDLKNLFVKGKLLNNLVTTKKNNPNDCLTFHKKIINNIENIQIECQSPSSDVDNQICKVQQFSPDLEDIQEIIDACKSNCANLDSKNFLLDIDNDGLQALDPDAENIDYNRNYECYCINDNLDEDIISDDFKLFNIYGPSDESKVIC